MEVSRRKFLTFSLAGVAVASGGVIGLQWLQEEDFSALEGDLFEYKMLNPADRVLLLACLPAILGDQLLQRWHSKGRSATDLLHNLDAATYTVSQSTRDELRQLFDLLWNRLGKLAVAGIWSSWSAADPASIEQFVRDWRDSSLTQLNQGYIGLQQLCMGAAYADTTLWSQLGYDGPPFNNQPN